MSLLGRFLFIFLLSFCSARRFLIPPGNSTLIDALYSHGITIGEITDKRWSVYATKQKMGVLASLVPEYEQVWEGPRNLYKRSVPGSSRYTSYYDLVSFCSRLARDYPHLVTRFSLGQSVNGLELLGVRIRSAPRRRKVKLVANMHGDETVGRELLIRFADHLVSNYESDLEIRTLVDSCEIHILPSMNPDGFQARRRTNAHGYDLNRNFPDRFYGQITPLQRETAAIMRWSERENFTLSANFHGGSLVVNYPYDGNRHRRSGVASPTKENALFMHLAQAYSLWHPDMSLSHQFTGGITNGAAWYVLYGGMQDWNYVHLHDYEVTIEVSREKNPRPDTLPGFWEKNRGPLLNFVKQIQNKALFP